LHVLQQDLELIGVNHPRTEFGCVCRLGAIYGAVADQSGLPLTVVSMPDALQIVIYDRMIVCSVAAHP